MSITPRSPAISLQGWVQTWVTSQWKNRPIPGQFSAEINTANTSIVAPEDGRLGTIGTSVGSYVAVGSQLTSLVPDRKWVMANFKETQVANLKTDQKATFAVDALDLCAIQSELAHAVKDKPKRAARTSKGFRSPP